jgi:hypothetical protein
MKDCLHTQWTSSQIYLNSQIPKAQFMATSNNNKYELQGAYKLSEDFAKRYFHKYWTELKQSHCQTQQI